MKIGHEKLAGRLRVTVIVEPEAGGYRRAINHQENQQEFAEPLSQRG